MFELIAQGVVAALEHMDSTMITGLFVVVMVVLFALALIANWRRRAAAFCQSTPTLLTTLGILGTFLGIAIGLLDFDSSRIEYSIPLLLDGLKLAFTTSIVGILLSAALRLTQVLKRADQGPAATTDQTADQTPSGGMDLAALLQRQLEVANAQLIATHQLGEHLVETLERQHEAQLGALQRFAEQLSELGSRQLIAALESVIRDFNANLGEQFGENFRRLDASVEKLLHWQEQYREHMDVLGGQLDLAVAGIDQSHASLQALTQQARQISTHAEDQQATMQALRRETLELESALAGIAELRDQAKEVFPAIDQRLRAMLESIEGAVLSALEAQQRIGQLGLDPGHLGASRMTQAARAHA